MPEPEPTPQLAESDVRVLVRGRLDADIQTIEPLAGSVGNQNFRVDTVGGRYAIKFAAESELAAERWGLERAAGVGVPVPPVVAAGSLPGDRGFMITGWLSGRPARETDTAALIEAGRALRRYHEITGPGYGRVVVESGTARGLHDSWVAMIDTIVAQTDDLVRHEVITDEIAERFRVAVDDHADAIAYSAPGALLHCDLKPAHLFVDDHRLAAIIDWGDTSYGDPRYDVARLSLAGDAAFRTILDGYGLELDVELARTLACYRAILRVAHLHYELMAGGDWFDVYRTTITTWLDSQPQLR